MYAIRRGSNPQALSGRSLLIAGGLGPSGDASGKRDSLDMDKNCRPAVALQKILGVIKCKALEGKKVPYPMNVARQPNHTLSLSVLLVILLWAGSTSFAHAAGYWACSGGKWITVGHPEYAIPIKSCGSRLEIPRTQLACERAGGSWGPAGIFPNPICKMLTHDAGRPCAD